MLPRCIPPPNSGARVCVLQQSELSVCFLNRQNKIKSCWSDMMTVACILTLESHNCSVADNLFPDQDTIIHWNIMILPQVRPKNIYSIGGMTGNSSFLHLSGYLYCHWDKVQYIFFYVYHSSFNPSHAACEIKLRRNLELTWSKSGCSHWLIWLDTIVTLMVVHSQTQSCRSLRKGRLQSSSVKSCLGTNEVDSAWFCTPAEYCPNDRDFLLHWNRICPPFA